MVDPLIINEETIALARSGDLSALNKIMIAFQKAIFNHLYRLTGSKEDAADLTQETFFKLYKKKHQIDPKQNFKAWVYKIATNTAYDWFDKNKRRNEVALVTENDDETKGHPLPYYRVDNATSLDLELALQKIKPAYQTVIFLYYQQGFSYEEMAEILETPPGTVKTLLHRAKKALAEEFK